MEEKKRKKNPAVLRMRGHHRWLTLILLVLVLVILVVNLVLPDRAFSDNENRTLAQRPGFEKGALLDGSYYTDFDKYYADQFVLRDAWITLRYYGNRILGRTESGDVYIGKDGYLFAEPETMDAAATAKTVDAINAFAQKYPTVPSRVMIVPDAAMILGDRLPPRAPVTNQLAAIEYLQDGFDGSVQMVDAASALRHHAGEDIFYKTDHHWTSLGAYSVFQDTAAELGIEDPVQYKSHTISYSFEGTLASKSGCHTSKDVVQVYEPLGKEVLYYVNYPDEQIKKPSMFESEKLEEKDQYTVFFGGNHAVVEIHTTANTGKNLLIFKDSYANSFMQFLTPYYDNIFMIDPRYYYDDVSQIMTSEGITDILYLYSADTLFKDTALADTLNAALAEQPENVSMAAAGTFDDVGASEDTETEGETQEVPAMEEDDSPEPADAEENDPDAGEDEEATGL